MDGSASGSGFSGVSCKCLTLGIGLQAKLLPRAWPSYDGAEAEQGEGQLCKHLSYIWYSYTSWCFQECCPLCLSPSYPQNLINWCPQGLSKWCLSPGVPKSLLVRPVPLIPHLPPDLCQCCPFPGATGISVPCYLLHLIHQVLFLLLPEVTSSVAHSSMASSVQSFIKVLQSCWALPSPVLYPEKCPVVWGFWNHSILFFFFWFL